MKRHFDASHANVLIEMLEMRRSGKSHKEIAEYYSKDRTTIVYHCQKHDVYPDCPPITLRTITDPKTDKVENSVVSKYEDIIHEPINLGKLSYADYLKADFDRRIRRHIKSPSV